MEIKNKETSIKKLNALKVKCPKCKYSWETKSKMIYITCPNCQRKFKEKIKW